MTHRWARCQSLPPPQCSHQASIAGGRSRIPPQAHLEKTLPAEEKTVTVCIEMNFQGVKMWNLWQKYLLSSFDLLFQIYIHTPVGWFIITLFPVRPHALGVGVYSSLTFSLLMAPKCGMKAAARRRSSSSEAEEVAAETLQERTF